MHLWLLCYQQIVLVIYMRAKASTQGLKYNKRTMTWRPENSLNLIEKVQIPEDETPAGRVHPIPLGLVAPQAFLHITPASISPGPTDRLHN